MVISVDEVKTILNISGSTKDDTIELLIPVVTSFIEEYCNTKFMSGSLEAFGNDYFPAYDYAGTYYEGVASLDIVQVYPEGLKLAASQMINYHLNLNKGNISSETIGDYSVTYNLGYPPVILDLLKPFRRVSFV